MLYGRDIATFDLSEGVSVPAVEVKEKIRIKREKREKVLIEGLQVLSIVCHNELLKT